MKRKYEIFVRVFKNNINPIFILILISLCVRLIALPQNYIISRDGALYVEMAKLFSEGEFSHPLLKWASYYVFFPFFISLFNKVVGDWVLAGQLISFFFGTLAVIPLYLLAKQIFDTKIAFLGGFFYCINPKFVGYSTEVLRDFPYCFFFTMALWLGYKGIIEKKIFLLGFAGLFIAISASLRLEGLALLICLNAFLIWHSIKKKGSWRRLLASTGLLWTIPFVILMLFGFMFAQKGINFNLKQITKSKAIIPVLLNKSIAKWEDEIEKNHFPKRLDRFINLSLKHRFVLYASQIIYSILKVFNILFLLFLFGLINRKVVQYRQEEFLLFAVCGVFIIIFFLELNNSNYLSVRYTFSIVMLSLIWCGVGLVELTERLKSWLETKNFQLRPMVLKWLNPLILLLICTPLLTIAWQPIRKDKLELKEIGLWLKKNGYDHATIVGQKEFSRLAFYAESDFILLENKKYTDLSTYSRKKNASLLVINKNTISNLSPNFFKLVSKGAFRPIHIPKIKTPKYATQVFEVNKIK